MARRAGLLLCGEERFLVERTIAALREEVLGKARRTTICRRQDAGAAGVISAARTVPMLGNKRPRSCAKPTRWSRGSGAAAVPARPEPRRVWFWSARRRIAHEVLSGSTSVATRALRSDPRARGAQRVRRGEAMGVRSIRRGSAAGRASAPISAARLLASSGSRCTWAPGARRRARRQAVVVQARSDRSSSCARRRRRPAARAVVLGRMIEDRERPTGIVAMLARTCGRFERHLKLRRARGRDRRAPRHPSVLRPSAVEQSAASRQSHCAAHETLVATDRAPVEQADGRIMELCVLKLVACVATPRGGPASVRREIVRGSARGARTFCAALSRRGPPPQRLGRLERVLASTAARKRDVRAHGRGGIRLRVSRLIRCRLRFLGRWVRRHWKSSLSLPSLRRGDVVTSASR